MKKNKIVVFLLAVIIIAACNNNNEPKEQIIEKKSDTAGNADPIRTNTSFLYDIKALEEIFTNDNWLITDKKDSSYFYFSRLGDFTVNTYEYRLVKGDSALVKKEKIGVEGDKITWNFKGEKLQLDKATKARAVWSVSGKDSMQYEFVRIDNNQIGLVLPDKRKLVLQKILPLSTFLVKSRYDFMHGTKLAFDSSRSIQK